MIRNIELESGQSVELNSSIGWLLYYKEQFGKDILPDLMPLIEATSGIIGKILMTSKKNNFNVKDILSALDEDTKTEIFMTLSCFETTTILNIMWAMNKNANKKIKQPIEWANQFEVMPFDVVVPIMAKMIVESSVSSKNLIRLKENLNQSKNQ